MTQKQEKEKGKLRMNMKKRYEKECLKIGELSNNALNLEKNVNKTRFEDLDILSILNKIDEEILELKKELIYFSGNYLLPLEPIDIDYVNFERVILKLSDVLACLAGLLSWINNQKNIRNDDCA